MKIAQNSDTSNRYRLTSYKVFHMLEDALN